MDNEKIDLVVVDRIDVEWLVDKREEFCSVGLFWSLGSNDDEKTSWIDDFCQNLTESSDQFWSVLIWSVQTSSSPSNWFNS